MMTMEIHEIFTRSYISKTELAKFTAQCAALQKITEMKIDTINKAHKINLLRIKNFNEIVTFIDIALNNKKIQNSDRKKLITQLNILENNIKIQLISSRKKEAICLV